MKKLIQLILAGMMLAPMSLNAQDTKSFVKQYKKQHDFTVVTLGKPVMRMLNLFTKKDRMEGDASQILKHTDAVQVLAFEGGRARGEAFNSEVLDFCTANQYEELIEVTEFGETVKIFCKTEEEAITGLIILNGWNRKYFDEMVCIKGRFTNEDLQTLAGKNGKQIAGLN